MMEVKYNDIYTPITQEELARIPEEMRAEKRWICWGSDKVPVSVIAGQDGNHFGIDVTKPVNWGSFEQVTAAIGKPAFVKYADEYFHIVGIGFVVGDGWFCADLDGGAAHKKEDVPEEPIMSAVIHMHTYIEESLSGCGYHVFGICEFDTTNAEKNKPHRGPDGEPVPDSYEIEFFTRRKFIAITGRIVETKKYCANEHVNTALNGKNGAWDFYKQWVLTDVEKDEEKRAAERAERLRAIPVDRNDANTMFLLNYREILAASDSSNFRRGGPGSKLATGEYSWIAAVKAMQEIGIPESDIIEWCRRGSNFKSEKDVRKVLDKTGKPGTATVAGIVEDAKAHGWKPDPDKLTGEYKENHDKAEYERRQLEKYRAAHRDEHAAALAALGIDCAGDPYRFTWTLDFDGSMDTVTEIETGEIVYSKPKDNTAEIVQGITIRNAAQVAPVVLDPDAPWEPIERGKRLPTFPLDTFPAWMQEHILNYSATTGVNTDYCAAAVLGSISAVIAGHCDVVFNGDHREPAQLYAMFVGGSGTMKSSVIKHFMKPAADYLRRNNEKTTKANYAITKQIEDLEKQLSMEKKAGNKGNPEKQREIAALLDQKRQERHNQFPVPLDDVTPESLVNAMKFSRGTANIATAEGNIINVICNRSYTQRGAVQNLDVFLKGADAESIHQSRVTTGEIDIMRADISILLAVQPSLLERLCNSPDAVGRGLAQRFLIYAQEEQENAIDHTKPVYMDPEHAERWREHIETIAARFMDPDSPAKLMELEPAADMIIREFWNYETELKAERGSGDEESITGWISKLHGKALRVAAILALLRDENAQTISAEDATKAVYLFKSYYIPQYIGAYEKADILTREQRQIVNWIVRRAQRTGNQERFTEHELWIDVRQRVAFSDKNTGPVKFHTSLDDLRAKNYIRPAAAEKTGSGRGRTAKAWQVNPEVYTK